MKRLAYHLFLLEGQCAGMKMASEFARLHPPGFLYIGERLYPQLAEMHKISQNSY